MGRSAKGLLKRVRNRETSLLAISGGCWLQRWWCLLMNREVYHNMPHKSLQALRWTQMNCRYVPVLSNHNFVTSNLWLVHCGYVQVLNFVTWLDLQKGTQVGEDGWWHGAFNNSTGQAGQQTGEGGGRQGGGEGRDLIESLFIIVDIQVREEIFCSHKADPVMRPWDPKPYWVMIQSCNQHQKHKFYISGGNRSGMVRDATKVKLLAPIPHFLISNRQT